VGVRAATPLLQFAAPLLLGFALVSPAVAMTIELKDVASDRIERQRRAAYGGLPLPGTPDIERFQERLASKGLAIGSDVFIRIFKAESELELWLRNGQRFVLFETYPICHWSGTLGPKIKEGDKQNPEGFYKIRRRQLHLAGRWPRSLNLGFPNPYDRALSRTGSYILVHGGCSSTGCFAMTNSVMQEIFTLTEKALRSGQEYVNIHVFPFRMTEDNMERYASRDWSEFWRNLKEGYDAFEATHLPPRVGVCDKRYVVEQMNPEENPAPSVTALARRERLAAVRDFTCFAANVNPSAGERGETADGVRRETSRASKRLLSHRAHRRHSRAEQPAETTSAGSVFRQE
jgi:murein L,D-transpeptidase YafK